MLWLSIPNGLLPAVLLRAGAIWYSSTEKESKSISRTQGMREPNGIQSTACIFCIVWERAQVVQKHNLVGNQLLSNRLFLSYKNEGKVLIIYRLLSKSLNSSNVSQTVLQDRSEREGPCRSFWWGTTTHRNTLCCVLAPCLNSPRYQASTQCAHNTSHLLT